MPRDERLHLLEKLVEGVPADIILAMRGPRGEPWLNAFNEIAMLNRIQRRALKRTSVSRRHAAWMAGVRRSLRSHKLEVYPIQKINSDGFFADFYAQNRPVLLNDESFQLDDRFLERIGRVHARAIEVQAGASHGDVGSQARSADQLKDLRDCLAICAEANASTSFRISVNAFERGQRWEFGKLLERLTSILSLSGSVGDSAIWTRPAGAVRPLSCCSVNLLVYQALGAQEIIMLSPEDRCFVRGTDYSELSAAIIPGNTQGFPLFRFARPVFARVKPGSALFIPVGWLSLERALETSLSASVTAFGRLNWFPDAPS